MKMQEIFKKQFHDSVSQFITPSEVEFEALLGIIEHRSVAKNDFFVREGQHCCEITFIISGMMRHYYHSPKGEVTHWIAMPGTFTTSLLSFITSSPTTENIQAIEYTELFSFPQAPWRKLCSDFPVFKDLWMTSIELRYLDMEDRVHHLISKTADHCFEIMCRKYPEMIKLVPPKYIASMLGIQPRHLNRIRKAKRQAL